MSARDDCWSALRGQIGDGRTASDLWASAIQNAILRTLRRTAERGHCSRNVQGWLEVRKTKGGLKEVSLASMADGRDNRGRPAIRLRDLHHIEDGATLAFNVSVSERAPKGIRAYTVCLQGRMKRTHALWYARVDLTEESEGGGLCGHALLHCHMGGDPNEAEAPEAGVDEGSSEHRTGSTGHRQRSRIFSPRVPLPWLRPWEALEWLLATAEPTLEPSATPPCVER